MERMSLKLENHEEVYKIDMQNIKKIMMNVCC